MATGKLGVFITIIRTEGPWGIVRRLAFTYSRVHTFTVMRMRLDSDLPEPRIPDGFQIKEVAPKDVAALRATRTDLPEYFFRDEVEHLDRCWVGLRDGILGFICWISYRGSSGMISLERTDAELAYIYSMPDFRGNRLTTQAVLVVAAQLRADGFRDLWAVPNTLNPAIVRSFEACGLGQVFTIRRYGPIKWPRTPVDLARHRSA